ncbi:MAG TPA: hypothetical protein VHO03_20200 [Ignavibacteriales bacterium]|nr:hypothetical protein [Ignavibacteriales bacterium]
MSLISILFSKTSGLSDIQKTVPPECFSDLNLDQIVDSITANFGEYDLKKFFYFTLENISDIEYRHEVFLDLEDELLFQNVKSFTEQMREVRRLLGIKDKVFYEYQKEVWFLYAAETYTNAVHQFTQDLSASALKSKGFLKIKEYFTDYTSSNKFISLKEKIKKVKEGLSGIKYLLNIKGNAFTVRSYEAETDYGAELEETFEKFRQGPVKDYHAQFPTSPEFMNHVEAKILDFVSQLYPVIFSGLKDFYLSHGGFIDEEIAKFDSEIHFYIAYVEFIKKLKRNNLKFCYPEVVSNSKEVYNYEGFDLALAQKLINENTAVVTNDFCLQDKERVIVVTGPNQGGKTTFGRMFGQLHYLSGLGCPVPGSSARLFHFDRIFTQFEKAEKVEDLRGKLEDDLSRIHSILDSATSRSILIMNEIFNSTTLKDTTYLSREIMERIIKLGLLCVWVTFIDELSRYGAETVSMTSTVVKDNPALRTFRILRKPADGLAYAMAIAEKYHLDYKSIRERLKK